MQRHVDAVLWAHLYADILEAMATERLPPPPSLPRFALDTVRPPAADDRVAA